MVAAVARVNVHHDQPGCFTGGHAEGRIGEYGPPAFNLPSIAGGILKSVYGVRGFGFFIVGIVQQTGKDSKSLCGIPLCRRYNFVVPFGCNNSIVAN